MSAQRMIEIKLGPEAIRFDEDALTNKQIRQFRLDISKEVDKYDEDMQAIQDKFQVLVNKFSEDAKKKDGEEDGAHEKRLKKLTDIFTKESEAIRPPEDNYWLQDLAFRLLKVVARYVGQEHKVIEANFDEAPWKPLKEALARILVTHECSAGTLFLPPKLSEEN